MQLTTSPLKIARILGLAALVILFADVVARIGAYFVNSFWRSEEVAGLTETVYTVLHVGNEASILTWYSSLALLLCSVLLAAITVAKKQLADRYTRHWGLLSVIFLLLSMDEVAQIHETIDEVGSYVATSMGYTPQGFLYFIWVVPAAIFVLVILLMYLRFLAHLPKKTLLLFLVAGLIFVGGAIGVEMLSAQLVFLLDSGAIDYSIYNKGLLYMMILIEEALEMLGVIAFIYALLSYMRNYVKEVAVQLDKES